MADKKRIVKKAASKIMGRKAAKKGVKKAKPAKAAAARKGRLDRFYAGLKRIIDPHTGMNIVDMGMTKNVKVSGDTVTLDFTPTSPFCPAVHYFIGAIEAAARKAGFKECKVNVRV